MARSATNKENIEQGARSKVRASVTGNKQNSSATRMDTHDPNVNNDRATPLPPRFSTRHLSHATGNHNGNNMALDEGSPTANDPPAKRAANRDQPAGTPNLRTYPTTPRPPPIRRIQGPGFTGGTPLHSGTSHPSNEDHRFEDVALLKAKLAAAEAREVKLRSQLEVEAQQPAIVSIPKPKGEAGDDKRGFNLRNAMELDGNDSDFLYADILRAVRRNAERAGIDLAKTYREQDHEVLARVFKAGRKDFEYLSRARFPNDWAQSEILKQYLKNARRYQARLQRERAASTAEPSVTKRKRPAPATESVRATESLEPGPSHRLHKRRHLNDDENSEVDDRDNIGEEDDNDNIYG